MSILNLPIGTIIAWENSDIPANWAVCDGNNGTPNLIDQFVLGASIDGDIRATGGSEFHTHTNSNTGTRTTHNHGGSKGITTGGGGTVDQTDGTGVMSAQEGHQHSASVAISGANSHSHTVGVTGGGSSLPSYIYRVFIRKIS